jgi:hypothetical protein
VRLKHTERSAQTRGEFLVTRFSAAHISSLVIFFFRPPIKVPPTRFDLASASSSSFSAAPFGGAQLRVKRRVSVLRGVLTMLDARFLFLVSERLAPRLGGMLSGVSNI